MLYAKIHKNRAENLLHLMLYFSIEDFFEKVVDKTGVVGYNNKALFKCDK